MNDMSKPNPELTAKARTEEIYGIYFPTDISIKLWRELKQEPDFLVKLMKIHKSGNPDSNLTIEDFEKQFMIRAAFEILASFHL